MLGNIIGGFIVILVGTALLPTVKFIALYGSNSLEHNPEYRLKSLQGQDRSVNTKSYFEHALQTDKGFQELEGYTVGSHTIDKICVNTNEHSKLELHKLMVT